MIERNVELFIPDDSRNNIIKGCQEVVSKYLLKEKWAGNLALFMGVLDFFRVSYPVGTVNLLSAFTGGGGMSGGMCDGLNGSLAVLGYIYGGGGPLSIEDRVLFLDTVRSAELGPREKAKTILALSENLLIINRMVEEFKQHFGHTDCFQLLTPFHENMVTPERFQSCSQIVLDSTGIVAGLILDIEKQELGPLSFGQNIYSHMIES